MTSQDLQSYVSTQISQGVNPEVIRLALVAEGVEEKEIDAAIAKASTEAFATSGGITSPKFETAPSPAPVIATAPVPVAAPVHSSNKIKIAVTAIIAVLALSAAGAYTYAYLNITPAKITQRFLDNYDSIQTMDFGGTISLQAKSNSGDTDQTISGQFSFSGTSDATDAAHPKSQINLKFTGEGFSVNFDMITVDEIVYLKVNEFPALGFFDAGQIENQWIKIDGQALAKAYGTEQESVTTSSITPEQIQQFKNLFAQHQIFKLTNKLASQEIDGTPTYHYNFEINKPEFIAFIKDAVKLLPTSAMMDSEQVAKELDQGLSLMTISNGEIWFGKKDYLPRKISVKIAGADVETSSSGSVDIVYTMGNFNKPTQIQIPTTSKDIQELLKDIMGGSNIDDADLSMEEEFDLGLNDSEFNDFLFDEELAQ